MPNSPQMLAQILRRPDSARYNLIQLRDAKDPGEAHRDAVAAALKADAGSDKLAREALEGDGWAENARARWAVDLRREASALVQSATDAAGVALEPGREGEDGKHGRLAAPLDPQAGETPDGPALALDLAGIEYLESLAERLGTPDSADADRLRHQSRGRWSAYTADPEGTAPDPLSEALAEHTNGDPAERLTNRGNLWAWWVREETPGEPVPRSQIATHKPNLGSWRFYGLSDNAEGDFLPALRGPAPFLRHLAWVLWHGRWRAEAERLKGARNALDRNPAGLLAPVYRGVGDALVLARPDYESRRLVAADGRQLPLLPATALDRLTGAPALGKLTAQRLVRWLVWSATQGFHLGRWGRVELPGGVVAEHHRTGVNLVVNGGLSALQEAIGARSNKASNEIRDVLNVLNSTRLEWDAPGDCGAETLIGWREETLRTGPDSPAVLTIRVGPLLCPNLAPMLPKGSRDRLIVPVLPLPDLPSHSSQSTPAARLDWLAIRCFAERGREALAHGGVVMDWDQLAKDAGLSANGLRKALALWTTGNAPRWVEVRPGRWDLGEGEPTVKAARDFILDGARRSEKAAEAGRRSGAARRRKMGGRKRKG